MSTQRNQIKLDINYTGRWKRLIIEGAKQIGWQDLSNLIKEKCGILAKDIPLRLELLEDQERNFEMQVVLVVTLL
jgi:hypothetical protein